MTEPVIVCLFMSEQSKYSETENDHPDNLTLCNRPQRWSQCHYLNYSEPKKMVLIQSEQR